MCMIWALSPSAHGSYRSEDRQAMSFLALASVLACSIAAASIDASCMLIARNVNDEEPQLRDINELDLSLAHAVQSVDQRVTCTLHGFEPRPTIHGPPEAKVPMTKASPGQFSESSCAGAGVGRRACLLY